MSLFKYILVDIYVFVQVYISGYVCFTEACGLQHVKNGFRLALSPVEKKEIEDKDLLLDPK